MKSMSPESSKRATGPNNTTDQEPRVELENVTVEEDDSPVRDKRVRVNWNDKEDGLLITAWLNVSKDSVVGTERSFWRRVEGYYDKNRKDCRKISWKHMKDRWHRLSPAVFKFHGCYKQIVQQHQSGGFEKGIIEAAHELYRSNYGRSFGWERAWRSLKDESKWIVETHEGSSKRCKVSDNGAHSSSSNPETPTSSEFDGTSPLLARFGGSSPRSVRPMDQEAPKRKVKAKVAETSSAIVDDQLKKMQETAERRLVALEQLARAKEEEIALARAKEEEIAGRRLAAFEQLVRAKEEEITLARAKEEEIAERRLAAFEQLARAKEEAARAKQEEVRAKQLQVNYEILLKDTSGMTESQRKDHEMICEFIRKKFRTM